MGKRAALSASLAVSILLGSCSGFWDWLSNDAGETPPRTPTSAEIEAYQTLFMSSYWAERGGAPASAAGKALTPFLPRSAAASKATVPVDNLSDTSFATLAANPPASNTIADYPEPGQSTVFTVASVSGTPAGTAVYDITATTSYASGDLRKTYVEEYYVQDLGLNTEAIPYFSGATPDLTWTIDDPIVKKDESGNWTYDTALEFAEVNQWLIRDQKARIRQVLTFQDGTTREETIVADSNSGGSLFAAKPFAVEGSLDLSQAFVPDKVEIGGDVLYSSVIVYNVTPATKPAFWFWEGSVEQSILGIRYYTEAKDEALETYTAHTVSFEKVVSALVTTGGSMTTTLKGVTSGTEFDALAENVLRQQVVSTLDMSGAYPTAVAGTGLITTNMRSRVVNITGSKDFYIDQLNKDAAKLTLLDTSLYTPPGAAEELLAGKPELFAYMREQQVSPAEGSLPFAIETTNLSGTGVMAEVYTAITEGSYSTVPTAPASNVLPSADPAAGSVLTFNGQQSMGTLIASSAVTTSNAMGSKGTVEAWIYIEAFTNTPGIVHKGEAVDFADECFSLQGWGSSGQMAIILDKPGSGNT